MIINKYYRNIYAELDIIATGDTKHPIYHCEDALIGLLPVTADIKYDLAVLGKLYVCDLVYGVPFNKNRITKLILEKL